MSCLAVQVSKLEGILTKSRNFDDAGPEEFYRQFARRANCLDANATDLPSDGSVFKCLQNTDTLVLQNASAWASYGAQNGQWAFIPVTDGTLLRDPPEVQLLKGKANGESVLSAVSNPTIQ